MTTAPAPALARLTADLLRPAAYGFPVTRVELRETHISLVFFAADRVYKVKKPVDLGFLDFGTLERRRFFCEEEVRLNRRLAPEVYLGTVPITAGRDGRLRVGGDGEPVEWAVEMVRLPEGRMLARLLERGELDNDLLEVLALVLAEFHLEASTGPDVDEHGSPAAIAAAVEQNFEQLAPFAGGAAGARSGASDLAVLSRAQLAFLRARAHAFLERERPLLERRVAAGRIREGHGDLHAENICTLAGRPVIYDCIEFSRALRCVDVASDLAFLAMDMDMRGASGFASYLVHRYAELARDRELHAVLGFYKGYRALVRAKVAMLTAAARPSGDARVPELLREAQRYLLLASGYELGPVLVLLCGLPASGKSFLAPDVAHPLRAQLLHSDVRRKHLTSAAPAGYGEGRYAPAEKRRVYRSLLEDAVSALRSGRSAVIDASFSKAVQRAPFVDAVQRLGLPWTLVWLTATEEETRARLARRERTGDDSEADLAVYLRAREEFEPPHELPPEHVLRIESPAGSPEDQASHVLDHLITFVP